MPGGGSEEGHELLQDQASHSGVLIPFRGIPVTGEISFIIRPKLVVVINLSLVNERKDIRKILLRT